MNGITYREFKRRVFNAALLECMSKFTLKCCGGSIDNEYDSGKFMEIAKTMSDDFYKNVCALNDCTINKTKENLSEAVTFIQDCIAVSEAIAEEKANDAAEEHLEIPEDQNIELSKEDQEVIDTLYDDKAPTVQIDAVRDATVKALMAEDRKAQEIKDAVNIANAQVQSGEAPAETVQETVNRLSAKGPTSLMHAIINGFSRVAMNEVTTHAANEGNNPNAIRVDKVMAENASEIKNRAIIMYSLFEASSVLGIKKYTPQEVKKIAEEIYYG